MRPFAATSKVVLTDAALIVASIDELDLQDAVCLALLAKKRVDDGAPALADVVDPVLMDEGLQLDGFALPVEPFE